jgi:molybdopterin molybdotransferase
MSGLKTMSLPTEKKELTEAVKKKAGLTYFLKGKISGNRVIPLEGQESFMMRSFARADCLICLDEIHGDYHAGEQVIVHRIQK